MEWDIGLYHDTARPIVKPKVLVWQWGRFGTGPRYALELARALSQHCGYETLLSLAEGAELMQVPTCREAVDLPLYTYASAGEFVRRSLAIEGVLRPILSRLHDDPPHATIVTMVGYWDIFLVRRLHQMGVPVVVMAHDAEVHPGDRFHVILRLQRQLVRMSQGVITLTDFVARQIKSRVPIAGKMHVTIPHPAFDLADLNLPAPSLPDAQLGRPLRLLMIGRLKRYKGLELLADALRLLGNQSRVAVRVVGAAQSHNEIAPLASLPQVDFDLGWKSEREIIDCIDWSDAVVLPYIEASQSGVAPISFKRGRPVIATAVGGLPEQIHDGETGFLSEAGSAESLAATIRRLAQDRVLLCRLGKNAFRHAKTDISWRALAPRFGKFLEAVARG